MNPDPDYAMAYVSLRTDAPEEGRGNGFVFTIGRGNDVQLAAIRALEPMLVGLEVEELLDDMGAMSRRLVGESQFRWLGPEKGVMHMAIGAVVNALWDLKAKLAGLPLWRLLAQMSPEEIVGLVDFRYLSDALTSDEALEILKASAGGKEVRAEKLARDGYPAYTTSPGWLGYSDERLELMCDEAVADGFTQVKLKVGGQLGDDLRRCRVARTAIGDNIGLAVDANQVWDVGTAIAWVKELAEFDLAWVEEPTSPDDILGTAAIRAAVQPVPVAAGEHVANRVIFKQLLQAEAIDVMQIDACRVAGVNENIANILLAAKFGVPVCPHTGGVGLCELAQHLAMFDYVAVSGSLAGRRIEWIDHLHEHFVEPAAVRQGRYRAPVGAGASTELHTSSIAEYSFPYGPVWRQA
jgi:L-fuconate dehydratase